MWHDHQFSQRNRTTVGTVGVGVGGDRELGGGGTKCEKGGKKYMRRLRKIEGLLLLLQLCKETLKIANLPIIKLIHPFQASSNF